MTETPRGALQIEPGPPEPVRFPVMYQQWNWMTFLHWRYPHHQVQELLPSGIDVDVFDGSAWVGLTPFLLEGLRAPFVPALPWLSRSPETNVRTYVKGPGGRRGIWFFSLDIARLPAVAVARCAYFLPYMWSALQFERSGDRFTYTGRRILPKRGPSYRVVIEAGSPFTQRELGDLDHFLTARFIFFSRLGAFRASASVEHPRWPLWKARLVGLEQDLLSAANLPQPDGDPLVHFSPGVSTRITAPQRW